MTAQPTHRVPPLYLQASAYPRDLLSFPTRRSSDLSDCTARRKLLLCLIEDAVLGNVRLRVIFVDENRSEEHTSELQSRFDLVCRLLLEKKQEGYRYRCRSS